MRGQVRCAANGSVGREDELVVGTAASPRSVLVVGGGPAGMEAARVAAFAATRSRWSTPRRASAGAGRTRPPRPTVNADLLRWFEHQLELHGVEVRLGERLDADAVVAAGARRGDRRHRRALGSSGACRASTSRTSHAVDDLADWLLDGRRWVLTSSCSVATFPVWAWRRRRGRRGARVTVLEASDVFGLHLGLPGRWRRVHDLRAAGVTLAGGAEVLEVTPEVVRWRDLDGDHETGASAVLVTSEAAADTTLADELAGRGLDVIVVGDAGVGAGLLEHAMRGTLEVAVTL